MLLLVWANGYGSMLTPGRKPTLNAAAVLGCSAAAAVYGCVRPPSRAQTATPFASALLMLHLHWLITVDLGKDMECLTLAPMAMASGILVLCSLSLDVFVQRARAVAANGPQAPGTGGRVGGYELSYYLQGVRGTEDMVLASLAVNYAWTFLALLKWTFLEAPSWGFVAISAVLSAVQLGTRAAFAAVPAVARAGRGYYIEAVGGYYPQLAYWLALLCAWRTLWPDTPYDTSDGWFKRLPEEVKAGACGARFGSGRSTSFPRWRIFALGHHERLGGADDDELCCSGDGECGALQDCSGGSFRGAAHDGRDHGVGFGGGAHWCRHQVRGGRGILGATKVVD